MGPDLAGGERMDAAGRVPVEYDDLASEKKLREQAADVARNLERVAKDRNALASQRTEMDAARLAMEQDYGKSRT